MEQARLASLPSYGGGRARHTGRQVVENAAVTEAVCTILQEAVCLSKDDSPLRRGWALVAEWRTRTELSTDLAVHALRQLRTYAQTDMLQYMHAVKLPRRQVELTETQGPLRSSILSGMSTAPVALDEWAMDIFHDVLQFWMMLMEEYLVGNGRRPAQDVLEMVQDVKQIVGRIHKNAVAPGVVVCAAQRAAPHVVGMVRSRCEWYRELDAYTN